MKTAPIVTDESKSLCHQLHVLLVDDVPDAKRKMLLHSADSLRGNGQVVIALPWPRMGCTTDAVIVQRWALRRQTAFNELNSLAASLSRTTGRTYTMAELPYRWSRHPAHREKRIAAALDRFGAAMSSWKPCPHSLPGAR